MLEIPVGVKVIPNVEGCKWACFNEGNCTENVAYCIYEVANAMMDVEREILDPNWDDKNYELIWNYRDKVLHVLNKKRGFGKESDEDKQKFNTKIS